MLNDWKWEKINDYEHRLKNNEDLIIASLIYTYPTGWCCTFYNNDFNLQYQMLFDNDSIETIQWQATLWIDKKCNEIANSFHHIRDHLPSVHDLFDKIKKI